MNYRKQIANNDNRSKGGIFQIGYTSRVMREMGGKEGHAYHVAWGLQEILEKKVSANTPQNRYICSGRSIRGIA